MKRYCYLILLVVVTVFTQCNTKSNKNKESHNILDVNGFNQKKVGKVNLKDLTCYKIGKNYISIPSIWKFKKQNKAYCFFYLNNNNDNTYFDVIKYNIVTQNVDFRKYLKGTYSILVNDTVEIGQGYTVKKLTFKDRITYYCEFYTKYKEISYITYSMLFEKYGFLYDVSLKIEKDSKINYYAIFQNILYNLKIDGNPVFNINEELEKIQIVDLSL